MPLTTVVSIWVVTAGPTVVLVTAVVNPALVDRWICIAVAADGALAWFFHVSDTVFPLPVALRPLGAAGRPTTVRVKCWMSEPATFVAVIVNGYVPPVPAAGVPASIAVPSPLSLNLTPRGSAPFSDKPGVGTPVDVTVKVPAWPTVKVVPAGLVIPGAWLTVRVKGWVASGLTPFVAVIVNGYVSAGVRSRCSRKCRRAVPVVRERDSRRQCAGLGQCGGGSPVVVTVKVPAWPTVKVVPAGLVIRAPG